MGHINFLPIKTEIKLQFIGSILHLAPQNILFAHRILQSQRSEQ